MSTLETPRTIVTANELATWPTADVAPEPKGIGWVAFSAIALIIAGVWGIIEGILAITSSKVFVSGAVFVFSGLNTWGWIVLGLGALCVLAAISLTTGSELARWFGITVAGVNAIGQLMFIQAYPMWAIAMFAVDMVIIYGLAAYGGARLRLR